jgi:hypothetical protein
VENCFIFWDKNFTCMFLKRKWEEERHKNMMNEKKLRGE